ncbi:hypothetical protein OsJ_22102 [Oryza sativa Japonica Group]|uniref:Uncharacterized protein n=1 Tax=Oryza sativa subsp. japonica TaxID=39947 RepID=B9FQ40_ORYSJ|nr:hypothetical protein OsJ_22102 [Oryza sativa Japonica Group]
MHYGSSTVQILSANAGAGRAGIDMHRGCPTKNENPAIFVVIGAGGGGGGGAAPPRGEHQVVGFLQLRRILGNTACPAWQVADQSGSELRAH